MPDSEKLRFICDRLRQEFGRAGVEAAKRLREWLSGKVPYAQSDTIAAHLEDKHLALIFDSFRQVLPFGTGGRRGPVGYGPNRVNPSTLAMTVQGHCNYLLEHNSNRSDLAVVVANDVRVFNDFTGVYGFLNGENPLFGLSSRSLAQLACEIYAGNGIAAYFQPPQYYQGLLTTPEMAFHVRQLRAVGGIQLSASHNPPDDNGLKIYNEFGSQPVAPDDERLAASMQRVRKVNTLEFDLALERGLIRWLPEECHSKYIETYVDLYKSSHVPEPSLPIVYTPLNGCGRSSVGDLLERLGYRILIPPGDDADGSFSGVPLKAPNPEVPQATGRARKFADDNDCGIVLSSDPDADRVGVDFKLGDGSWYHFDGNQIATVLCHFLMLNRSGPQRRGLVIETFVTTRILGEIARKTGSPLIDNLPVGMKYVANVLNELELNGRYGGIAGSPSDLAFAAEESHGVMVTASIRDKDAAPACMYLACLYQLLRREGRNLLDYYVEILNELGAHDAVNRSILMTGADGTDKRDAIMSSLRRTPPKRIAGKEVCEFVDFWDEKRFGAFKGYTDKLSRDALQIFTTDFIVAVRPSGTEPKLKYYCHLLPPKDGQPLRDGRSLQTLRSNANRMAQMVYNELLARIDLVLGEVGLLVPDLVDLDRKRHFEQQTIPALRERLATGNWAALSDLLQWLRGETAAMAPGADPLPAIKEALNCQCLRWLDENDERPPMLVELAAWASG